MAELSVQHMRRASPSLRARAKAAAIHLLCCAAVAALVIAVVFFCWYPAPLDEISGVAFILTIMLGADVVLGPLVTLVVFDLKKKNLRFDLAVVVAVQLAALAYGLHVVYEGRPSHLVFVKDRFELIAPAEIGASERQAATGNAAAAPSVLGPKWVAVRMPADPDERQRILFEALERGKDVQHHPRLYEPYYEQAQAALSKAQPLSALERFNEDAVAEIEQLPFDLNTPSEMLRYLPLRGPRRDGVVIIRADTGEVLRLMALHPW